MREPPDTRTWQPRSTATETLASALEQECAHSEEVLLRTLNRERRMAVDSFDSGVPFEAALRAELGSILPRRYQVTSGLVLDRDGLTAGQCDCVIFNDLWFPLAKTPTGDVGRGYLPVEGAYAIGEVKQTLSETSLDEAMEKLVKCQRLSRPTTYANRLVENRESDSCPHGLTNPLFTFLLAGGVAPRDDLQSLIGRFVDTCWELRRLEVVRALCVLGEGTVVWSFRDPEREGELRPALFMKDDLFHPVVPTFAPSSLRAPLFSLMQTLHLHLFHSVLGPEDIATAYGSDSSGIKAPKDPGICLEPDEEWLESLNNPCSEHHDP